MGVVMRRLSALAFTASLAIGIAACTGGSNGPGGVAGISPAAGGSDGALGQNLAGESCRASPRTGAAALPGEPAPLDILCGTAKDPVGSLWTTAIHASAQTGDSPDQRHTSIIRAASETPGGQRLAERMNCDAGEWTGGSIDMKVSACTLKAQGWPQIVLLADIGGILYQAEGLPSLLPVLSTAIAQRSGTPITAADQAATSKIVDSRPPRAPSGARSTSKLACSVPRPRAVGP